MVVNGFMLTGLEEKAFREFAALSPAERQSWGRRRIVSMQGLETAGVVVRVKRNGLIAGWELTDLGEAATR